jgi:hypothetical protein
VNEGDEGEEILLMAFIYIHEIELWNLRQLFEVGQGGDRGERDGRGSLTHV